MKGLFIRASVDASKRHELIQMFQVVARNTVPGRRDAEVFELVGYPAEIMWIERWDDVGPMEVYMGSDPFRALLGAVKILGTLQEFRVANFEDPGDLIA